MNLVAPCLVVVGCCIAPDLAAAAPDASVELTDSLPAHRITGAIRIDGRLDEQAWQDAAAAGRFAQEAPHYGEPATSPTEVRVLYDDEYLYIGARMRHAPGHGGVTGLVHRR